MIMIIVMTVIMKTMFNTDDDDIDDSDIYDDSGNVDDEVRVMVALMVTVEKAPWSRTTGHSQYL